MTTRFKITNKVEGFYFIHDTKFDEFSNEMFVTKKECKEFIKELEKLSDKEIYLNDRHFVNVPIKTNIYKY